MQRMQAGVAGRHDGVASLGDGARQWHVHQPLDSDLGAVDPLPMRHENFVLGPLLYVAFLLFMVLILPSIGLTTVRALVESVIKSNDPDNVVKFNWECIFLPDNGAFFINYVTTSALVGIKHLLMIIIIHYWLCLVYRPISSFYFFLFASYLITSFCRSGPGQVRVRKVRN
mgnify:CR=1 FL=1